MTLTSTVCKIIEANRSLEKLISQNNEYPIKTSYNLIKVKKVLDEAINYVMERLAVICGNDVNFENATDEQKMILNSILLQEIDVEIPEIDINDVISADSVIVTPSDVEKISILFKG